MNPPRLYALGSIVVASCWMVACAAGGTGEDDGNVDIEQGGADAANGDSAAAQSDAGYGGNDDAAPVQGGDSGGVSPTPDSGFPPPTGADASTTMYDSGTTHYDSGTTLHDSGTTNSSCDPPDTNSSCTACMTANQTCQNNGCYNGYYCDYSTSKCYSASSCP